MRAGPARWLRRRRGAAVAVVMLLVLAVTGMGLLTIRMGQQHVTYGIVNTDIQRALDAADSCAVAAMKALPSMLDTYLTIIAANPGDPYPPLVPEQFDADFFGAEPYGNAPREVDCIVQIVDIVDDQPASGYSEGGGCFKRITLLSTASVSRPGTTSNLLSQAQPAVVREVIVRGLFGPVTCH